MEGMLASSYVGVPVWCHVYPHKTYVWGLVLSNDTGKQFVHVKADTACSVPKVSKTNNA